MACPFFKPLHPLDAGGFSPAPRLPLGGAWAGECCVPGAGEPSESIQREVCNSGYPIGRCDHFPGGDTVDAVRFSLAGDGLIYILEKDHAPVEHGRIDAAHDQREPLASQARAFIGSQRRIAGTP